MKLKVTLRKSVIGFSKDQKETIKALGLKRLNQTVEVEDTPVIRGMIKKVDHLLEVSEA